MRLTVRTNLSSICRSTLRRPGEWNSCSISRRDPAVPRVRNDENLEVLHDGLEQASNDPCDRWVAAGGPQCGRMCARRLVDCPYSSHCGGLCSVPGAPPESGRTSSVDRHSNDLRRAVG